jgi:Protein of unknown function (DUF1064)
VRPVRLPGTEPKRPKYGARRRKVDGVAFASGREANRYHELLMLEKAGLIRDLHRQVTIHLHAPTPTPGAPSVVGCYVADATYIDLATNRTVWEDSKGCRTPLYAWKRRHVQIEYGIDILET